MRTIVDGYNAETDAAIALIDIQPTTGSGLVALLQYAVSTDADGTAWPDLLEDEIETLQAVAFPDSQRCRNPARYRGGSVMDQLNLEASINDVTNMAEIGGLLMVQLADTLHEAAKAGVSGKRAIETHQWLVDLVSFASLETKLKAEALRSQFYAGTEEA